VDPYYARAYLDGWEGNLEGGTIIAEQGMASVPPGILARPLGAFGKFRGFVRGLIETPQAAVVKDFARYGGEAQRAALLERIQQTSGLSEKAGLVVQNRLQLMASEQNAIFAADPKAAIRLLSKSELNNAVRYPEAVYGRAMERAMAERIARNPALDRLLTYKGAGPGPDFTGAGRLVGQEFEVTTNKAWAAIITTAPKIAQSARLFLTPQRGTVHQSRTPPHQILSTKFPSAPPHNNPNATGFLCQIWRSNQLTANNTIINKPITKKFGSDSPKRKETPVFTVKR
jgi:hypothetical protein